MPSGVLLFWRVRAFTACSLLDPLPSTEVRCAITGGDAASTRIPAVPADSESATKDQSRERVGVDSSGTQSASHGDVLASSAGAGR